MKGKKETATGAGVRMASPAEAQTAGYETNKYTDKVDSDGIHYTDEFYIEMFRRSRERGMTYAQVYNSLGYDTNDLGERRAKQAGYRSSRFVMERFCNGLDDGVIDMSKEAGLTMRDFGISRGVINDIDHMMRQKERFLEQVILKRFDFIDDVR